MDISFVDQKKLSKKQVCSKILPVVIETITLLRHSNIQRNVLHMCPHRYRNLEFMQDIGLLITINSLLVV